MTLLSLFRVFATIQKALWKARSWVAGSIVGRLAARHRPATGRPSRNFPPAWRPPMEFAMDSLRNLLSYEPTTGVFTWLVSRGRVKAGDIAGAVHCNGYIRIQVSGKNILAHRLAWFFTCGAFPAMQIDHINGDKRDNRIENLRDVTPLVNSQNMRGARAGSKSGLLGVEPYKGKWRARIRINGKRVSLGCMDSKEDAHSAYVGAKRQAHTGCTI